jgi:tight adherence protein B
VAANLGIFLVLLIAVFSIVMLVTSPAVKENAVTRRLREMIRSQSAPVRFLSALKEPQPAAEQREKSRFRAFFQRAFLTPPLQRLIFQSHVSISPSRLLQIIVLVAAITYFAVWRFTGALSVSLVAASLAGYLPIAYLLYRRKAWLASFNATLPECIEAFTRSLRAGHSIVSAIDITAQQAPAPANTEFAEVFKRQKYGLPLRDALLQMIVRVPSMDLKIMITAILVQRETGGNLPGVLDRLVAVIRDRLRIQRDIRVHTAQGRLTGWILGILPPVLMLAINWTSPEYSSAFLHDEVGKRLLYIGAALLLIGVVVIRRIVNGIEV